MIWWKISIWHKKTWLHAIAQLFSIPTIIICKKWAKYNLTATAKFKRNTFGYSNTPKHAQNWLFWGIFSFFLFLRYIFWELWAHYLLLNSSNVGRNITNDRYMPQVYIKRNFQIWPKTKLSSLQSTVPPHRESKCPKIHFGWWRRHGLTIFKNKKLQTSHLTH